MKVSINSIKSVGLTTLYDPDDPSDAAADVVLVHGLGGHPVRSWKWTERREPPQTPKSATSRTSSFKRLPRRDPLLRRSNSEPLLTLGTKQDSSGRSRNVLRKQSSRSSSRLKLDMSLSDLVHSNDAEVYWPLDLLPRSCPNARIFVWGYHTLVAAGQPLRLQNDILAHARDLLQDLIDARETTDTTSRPIIFLAHSTGGIVVKEVLRLSEEDENEGLAKSIVLSTSATIFMGCPHRSIEHAALSDAIRSMASITLGVDSRDPVLWDLSGAASVELELGRQAFIRMWNDYNFKAKTYQESLVSAAKFIEIRAEAAVRRQSSFIGDPRESAETIEASHLDMCKFGSAEDSGYRSLADCLARYIRVEAGHRHTITDKELECLAALTRRRYAACETHSTSKCPGTWPWLYNLPEFRAWHHRTNRNKNKILWIKGESGSGKSVLLRSLRNRVEKQWASAGASIIWTTAGGRDTNAMFFPGCCQQYVGTDPSGVYRSLLAQLFLQDPRLRRALVALYEKQPQDSGRRTLSDEAVVSFFVDDYIDQQIETPARRTFIFIDVSDDCGPSYLRDLLGHLSQLARNSDFSICIATGNPLAIVEENAIDVVMQVRNADDILRYVHVNLVAQWEERDRTVERIGLKAAGVFLWAEIVVNILNAAIGEGASQDQIEYTLEEMPGDLHGLYEWMLSTLNAREKEEALVLFQWVILAAESLRLNDLLVAVRLTKTWPDREFSPVMALEQGEPTSMRDLRKIRNSEVTTDNPHQFARWIRARSIGLLELRAESRHDGLVNEPLGLQRVQVTHDSVRTFFLSGRGFACLTPRPSTPSTSSAADLIDRAHYALLHACLTYLNMRDFEPLASSTTHRHDGPFSPSETLNWQRSAHDQRSLIMTCYPFLRYAVRNLLFHLLCPAYFRYFLPQRELLRTLSADKCRLWRRWTALLGRVTPEAVVEAHVDGPAGPLLAPVYGGRFRLERVFRKLARLVAAESGAGTGAVVLAAGVFPVPPGQTQTQSSTPRSAGSERTVWGSLSSPGTEGAVKSPRSGWKSPPSEVSSARSPRGDRGKTVQPAWQDVGTWPLSHASGYASSSYSSKRSPLTADAFQRLDGCLGVEV